MSIRAISSRLFRHGQTVVRNICRDYNQNSRNIGDKINVSQATRGQLSNTAVVPRNFALRNVGLQFSIHARRIFVDNVLNRVTSTLASELRKKAARGILFGNSAPFLAFVGVSLASGTGIITKEDELEGICWEIREAISKFKWTVDKTADIYDTKFETESITVNNLDFGQPIAKGANAVVYEAGLKSSPLECAQGDAVGIKYPLAVKMMFNYDIQSNAMAILQAMHKETLPARQYTNNISAVNMWETELLNARIPLPLHPNIVTMFSVFTDYVPDLVGSRGLYPAALPSRLFSEGEGRNMSLFLVMKRYNCTLQEHCKGNEISLRSKILLFTQLLEGIVHLNLHGVAHRDLKSDNLLLDTSEESAPILVITDFGCCLADQNYGLTLPYPVYDIDKGGNTALMAPEIITQKPGTFSVLNYSKSDLWTAGTIAYEIFDGSNPFYGKRLRSSDYQEHKLPALPDCVPPIVKMLVKNVLKRNPRKRLNPEVAANVMQLFLWAPSAWLNNKKLPTSSEILQWLLCLTTKVLCEGRLSNLPSGHNGKGGRRTYPEYLLIASFLRRAKLSTIRASLMFIHSD
ncbi:hypothetical protein PPYR_09054 [Photinus pyralis]|uniref:non-specific serine/threonine protein kinase n=1 Tax=Photinus pyralis TaxID=7054 RepID=A0A1Y1NDB7_PHOPY|nr:serine/threonine-protein kinase PINK1, mitochondrial [Photinus pyralis]XP_031343958.1 serine/threonine-protein kinase PINK1, mitochondrial [Photinus pyralis]KAB0798061.1 hypothetical protein PPYR_09054 [Photinus pyralis]